MKKLEKYADAFCFYSHFITLDGEKLFYLWQKDDCKKLYCLDLKSSSDLTEGKKILDHDFSKGTFSIEAYDNKKDILYLILDESNKENYNLWQLDLSTLSFNQVTQFEMLYGANFSEDYTLCWCYDRKKLPDGTFESEVYEINLLNSQTSFLFNDKGQDYRIGWSKISKQLDADTFFFTVDFLNQRKKTNVCRFSLKERKWELLLPLEFENKGSPDLRDENIDNNGFIFDSNHEGFNNLYYFTFSTKSIHKITDLTTKTETLSIIKKNGKSVMNIVTQEADNYILSSFEVSGAKKVFKLKSLLYLFDTEDNFWGMQTSSDIVKTLVCLNNAGEETRSIPLTSYPVNELQYSNTSWITYKTFDGKDIKALLKMPKGEVKAACVLAFYGGYDYYSAKEQMYAENGIAFLSPAVRGSWGWGKEWEELLQGDLGGNEILDVIWGAKFLEEKLQLPSSKIGVCGGSHGGYATLRAITMPENYNNIPQSYYPFGFAICQVGFADLVAFYKDSRIADWLVHLLGPYDEKKYLERSPLTYFENLNTPLLIVNGKNDTRVPFSTMEKFIDKLKASNKDYELLIHEDQGHGTSNRKTFLAELQVETKFLERFI